MPDKICAIETSRNPDF